MRGAADWGTYLASPSTIYRLLRERGQVRERRAQARHEAKKMPKLPTVAWINRPDHDDTGQTGLDLQENAA